jgi:hypothetical protein
VIEGAAGRRRDTHQPDRGLNPEIYLSVNWSTMGGKRGAPGSRCETENRRGERGVVGSSHETGNGRGSKTRDIEGKGSGKTSTNIGFFTIHCC